MHYFYSSFHLVHLGEQEIHASLPLCSWIVVFTNWVRHLVNLKDSFISMHTLHIVQHAVEKIFLTITTFFTSWLFPLFSRLLSMHV